MKIIYLANARIPTEKAHGVQIMNTCAALSAEGVDVELVVPKRSNPIKEDAFTFYGLERSFRITRLPCLDLLGSFLPKKLSFALQTASFTISAFFLSLKRPVGERLIYGRDEAILAPLSLCSKDVYWESHTGSLNRFAKALLRRAKGVVSISDGLARLYEGAGLSPERSLVSRDAVDLRSFALPEDRDALREKLGLPKGTRIVTYSGSIGLYSWKGVDVFLRSLSFLGAQNIAFLIVGGTKDEIRRLRAEYLDERIFFAGSVRPASVPAYLKASDVLVLPNKSGNEVSERYTSPMKLFEYMASERPIVASDLPSIREVLNRDNSVLFSPNDPQALAQSLTEVLRDPELCRRIAKNASRDVSAFTWEKRAKSLVGFIESRR